jgi:hypothetical protein
MPRKQKKKNNREESDDTSAEPQFFEPYNTENIATFELGEETWSMACPPLIVGMLDPPPDRRHARARASEILNLRDPRTGQLLKGTWGKPIRDIILPSHLPDNLSTIHWEAYHRMNPSIGYSDFRNRQWEHVIPEAGGIRSSRQSNNAVNNKRTRDVRVHFHALDWSLKHKSKENRIPKSSVEAIDCLTDQQIDHNTSWTISQYGIHPPNNPMLLFPFGTFLHDRKFPHEPSPFLANTLAKRDELRQFARQHGYARWQDLPKNQLQGFFSTYNVSKGHQEESKKREETHMATRLQETTNEMKDDFETCLGSTPSSFDNEQTGYTHEVGNMTFFLHNM